ncbi:MAG: FAD-binding oxidoreductase [Mycobacteriales bacterium]
MRPAPLDALAGATGGHAGEAGPADAVDGVPARWVASPGSTDEAAAVLRVADERDLAVVARGAGTKLGWGAPPRQLDLVLDTRRLDRVVEHAAGDLVVVVQAGVPLAALADRLAGAGQRLAVDEVVPGSTVGGALATGLTGPRRLLAGGVRDLVLGATLVRADGVVARSGGKVVKNVAGYDVAKLVCGAYGTLGLVTEAAFRLHPVAPAAAFVSVRVPDADAAYAAVQRVLHAQFVPTAVELDRSEPGGPVEIAVLVEGTDAGVAARTRQALDALGPGADECGQPAWWGRLPAGDVLVKATSELAGVGRLLDGVEKSGPASVRGSAGVGVFHLATSADEAPALVETLRGAAPGWLGSVVVLAAPPAVRAAVDSWGPVSGLALMRRVKEQFDPRARLAPGRFVGGI